MILPTSMQKILPNESTGVGYWQALLSEPEAALSRLLEHNDSLSVSEMMDLFRRNISVINIETSASCNRVCSYCPDAIYDRKTQNLIDDSVWNRILDDIEKIQYERIVSLNLYNEPMLDPTLYEKIASLKQASKNCFVKFNSNGDFVNKETLAKLANAGLSQIIVTLHTPKSKPYDDAYQLNSLEKFFKRIGKKGELLDFIPQKSFKSYVQWEGVKVNIVSDNWQKYGNDRAGTVAELKRLDTRQNPCMRVFREFTISHKGDVFPCCQFFPDAPENAKFMLGNISQQHLFEVYASSTAVDWRRSMFSFGNKHHPCSTCADPDNARLDSKEIRAHLLMETV